MCRWPVVVTRVFQISAASGSSVLLEQVRDQPDRSGAITARPRRDGAHGKAQLGGRLAPIAPGGR